MRVELQQLRQVAALAEHGSFVRAAAALYISQPALSRSIQNVERIVGTALFLRGAAGVVPTDVGRVFIERARDVLRLAEELDGTTRSAGTLTGRVAVGAGHYPADFLLGPATARFIADFPGVGVRLDSTDWDGLLRRLRTRELDFFVAETSLLTREPDIEVAALGSSRPAYWVARAGHPLAGRTGIDASEVLRYPFVTPSRVPPRVLEPLLRAHGRANAHSGVQRPWPAIQCNGIAPVKRIVACSDAVTGAVLSSVSGELEAGQFALLGSENWLALQYGVVSLKGQPWTPAAARLLEYIKESEREVDANEARLLRRYGRHLTFAPAASPAGPKQGPARRRGRARGDATA
jgi:DNA-binding transcriptional LysR family regulator